VLAANLIQIRKVYVANSSKGLSAPDIRRFPQDKGSTLRNIPELAVSLDKVRANFDPFMVYWMIG
jgi:hypothetical protein